jgi:hypothetical protein
MVFPLMYAFTNVYQALEKIFSGPWRVVFYPLGMLVETEAFEVIHRWEQEVLLARYNTDSVGSCHVVKTPPSRRNEKVISCFMNGPSRLTHSSACGQKKKVCFKSMEEALE